MLWNRFKRKLRNTKEERLEQAALRLKFWVMERQSNLHSMEAELLFREGQHYQAHHAFSKALESYQKAALLEPERPAVYLRMGVVLSKLGRWKEAANAYAEAIRLDPQQSEAHLNLGFVYYELGLDERAQAELQCARDLCGLADPHGKMRF